MIIVTGANGQLGRAIMERLLQRVPAARLGVSVRDPEQASALAERGVRVRRGAFDDAASLRHAFEGASHVLIVSINSTGEAAVRQHEAALEAARAAGARRVLYTSHMGSNPASRFEPMRDHAATEASLQRSGGAFTSLRNGFYAASALMLLERALKTGELVAPEDGPVSWTEHGDLADAAAIALTDEARLDGLTPPLTAAAALDLEGVAAIASELIGRSITRVTVSDRAFREDMVSHGVPEHRADLLLGMFAASREREFAAVDPTLERLLGRAPMSMRRYLTARLSPPRSALPAGHQVGPASQA
ncbi:NAD(P)H-binding protein [Sorangium sp. So ce327]|uniref:NmrA family NAD(P)-binding protein n=1 Tax=Sorangium sp. So ce327 TaxID=3133301 RepID=UPI003F635B55